MKSLVRKDLNRKEGTAFSRDRQSTDKGALKTEKGAYSGVRKKDWLVGLTAPYHLRADSGKVSSYSFIVHLPLATGWVNSTRLCWMGLDEINEFPLPPGSTGRVEDIEKGCEALAVEV